jgi:primosomal protein N' (replication factor Y)
VQNIFKLDDIDIARNTTTPSIYVSQHTKDTRYSDTMFSREAFSHILDTVSNDKTVQIITARKGISGSVSCSNCAFIAKCATCNHVQSIVQSNKTKIRNLYCHKCRTKSPVYDNCPQCDGMLAPLGYTTQTIYEALQNIPALENVPITIIDSDTTKTFKKLQQHISNFQKHTKNIIITTPAMTDYLPKPDLTVVVSFEGLLANPAYDQDSVMYRLLKSIEGSTIIQTKNENLDNIWTSNSESYSNYESELSHTYHTPPSGTFLTLSRLIPAQNIHTEVQYIQECIGNYNYIDYLHSTRGVKKGREIMIHHHLYYDIKNNERITQEILPLFTAYSMKKNIRIL